MSTADSPTAKPEGARSQNDAASKATPIAAPSKPAVQQHVHKGFLIEQTDNTYQVGGRSFPSREAAILFIERSITHQS